VGQKLKRLPAYFYRSNSGREPVRRLGKELWEVRSNLTGGKIARLLFCVHDGLMVLLHGFIKKTQKTPKRDIDLALKRKRGEER